MQILLKAFAVACISVWGVCVRVRVSVCVRARARARACVRAFGYTLLKQKMRL